MQPRGDQGKRTPAETMIYEDSGQREREMERGQQVQGRHEGLKS